MSRSLSSAALRALHAPQTSEVFLVLLVISHPSLSPSIYLVDDMKDVTTGGHMYTAHAFLIDIPEESDGAPPTPKVWVDNTNRAVTDAIRSLPSSPTITMSIVLASSPGTVEAGPFVLQMSDMVADAFAVSANLGFERMLSEAYPGGSFTPADWPGIQ